MIYNRRQDIHALYGGNWQGGICPSSSYPYIFIFSGNSGKQHGYADGWDNPSMFSYTGEGQLGDMHFTRGNLALKNHLQDGKRVFLFESSGKGYVKFICELEIYDQDYFETLDTNGNIRLGIKFFFSRKGAVIPIRPSEFKEPVMSYDVKDLYARDIPNVTERQGLVTSRVGQGAYRQRIIHRWEYKCAVTKFDKVQVLIASHIVPWKEATHEERLDVDNGILLSPLYDALFDKHFISFDQKGQIVLSNTIDSSSFERVGVTGKEVIKNLSTENKLYLERHILQLQTL